GGGYYAASGSSNTVGNTIIDLNIIASVNPGSTSVSFDDVFAVAVANTFTSLGNNIFGTVTNVTTAGNFTGITSAQLNLQPLANYGGPTQTIALGTNGVVSIAINNGNSDLDNNPPPPISSKITTDQRGLPR